MSDKRSQNSNRSSDDVLYSALEQLRLKLLDLTSRNRLINYKHTIGKSLQFVEGQPGDIYRKLVETNNQASINILGLPEPAKCDWIERNGRSQRPEPRDWAKSAGIPISYEIFESDRSDSDSDLRTLMYSDDLAKHCRKIEREAVLAIEETGANMLFLVLGFLEFPEQRDSDKILTAPLICIPVSLHKKETTGIQSFLLQFTGEDISENLSLREKLRNDFGLVMPELDDDQIDVEGYFNKIRQIIKQTHGFSVKRKVSLCLLSFGNMLLVRDLDPSKWPKNGEENSLLKHPIVREIFEGKANDSGHSFCMPEEHVVEEGVAATIPLIYDADSSQHSALVDALVLKKDLVIEGPPGTGKSQTITNLIAACLAEGKTVLFVSEKLAALEIVKTRLSLAGLDSFVLELHSNKTNKKRVLEEIEKRIAYKPRCPKDLSQLLQQLDLHRKELKSYSDLINSVSHNALGLTLHQVMWRAEKHRNALKSEKVFLSQITPINSTQISEFELKYRMDCLNYLSTQYESIGGFDNDSPFWGFFPDQLVPGDEVRLANLFRSSLVWAEKLREDADRLSNLMGGSLSGLTFELCINQIEVLGWFLSTANRDLPFYLIPGFFENDKTGSKTQQALIDFEKQVSRYHDALAAVELAFSLEPSINKAKLEKLKLFQRTADGLGVELGNLEALHSLHQELEKTSAKLRISIAAISTFMGKKNIPFDGSRQKIDQLLVLTNLVVDAPEEHFCLQTRGLIREGSAQAIEKLLILQKRWVDLEKELNDQLYIDALPSKENINQAILTLREGDAWYRVFQRRWRKAVGLHKSIQRAKQKMSSKDRLVQLEKVIMFLNLKDTWKADPAWTQFLEFHAPVVAPVLEGYIALAKWNHSVKLASENIQAILIDPIVLTSDHARVLHREFSAVKIEISSVLLALEFIEKKFKRLHEFIGTHLVENVLAKTDLFVEKLSEQLQWLDLEALAQASYGEVIVGYEAALERAELKHSINGNSKVKQLLGELYLGVDTDTSGALKVLVFGQDIDALDLLGQIKHKLRSRSPIETCDQIKQALEQICNGLKSVKNFSDDLMRFGEFNLSTWVGISPAEDLQKFSKTIVNVLTNAANNSNILIPWSLYVTRRNEAKNLALMDFVEMLESKHISPKELADAYAYCIYSSITRDAFRQRPELGRFTGLKHNQIRDKYQQLDKKIIALRGQAIGCECNCHVNLPNGRNGARVDDKTEMALLRYLIPQQRPRMPMRKILMRAGGSIQTLKPCFMMGPQAVAQYLTPGSIKFDIVIMDEASQLRPEEAIGAIARGSQLVVVGDSKQLPPGSFFSRTNQADEDDDEFITTDAESILDVCSSHFQPTRSLRWHYRSQHHSLIAFSNHNFYRSNLIIFPSPYGQSGKLGVRAVYLADAIYEDQVNLTEAKRVVDAVVEHIADRPNESLGVVTLNIKQRDLIAELLEGQFKSVRGADAYRDYWNTEAQPLFIKNLENVQGDERDAIIISTTFGKSTGSSAVRQNFGPISRQSGWRRLNVLFTRAKKSIAIYTSLRPEDIVIDGTTPEGTRVLRTYLEYVRTGSLVASEESGHEPDSDFEIVVIDMLRSRGYEVTPQLGVAGYRIDIAVKHPDMPGTYLAAIECDGASYHSALSVRDRDRIRQEILESLGWRGRIWRIWSTDWFRAPKQEMEKLISFLGDIRKSWKPEHSSGSAWSEESNQDFSPESPNSPLDSSDNSQMQASSQAKSECQEINSTLLGTEKNIVTE